MSEVIDMSNVPEDDGNRDESAPMTPEQLKNEVARVQTIMDECMKEGVHYGRIKGASKPSLWQPGAQLLYLSYRLAPHFKRTDISTDDEVAFEVECTFRHKVTDVIWGSGQGSSTSKEPVHRNRNKSEVRNTLIKMACKRALVAATMNVTPGATAIFTQDLEDFRHWFQEEAQPAEQPKTRRRKAAPKTGGKKPEATTPSQADSQDKPTADSAQAPKPRRRRAAPAPRSTDEAREKEDHDRAMSGWIDRVNWLADNAAEYLTPALRKFKPEKATTEEINIKIEQEMQPIFDELRKSR